MYKNALCKIFFLFYLGKIQFKIKLDVGSWSNRKLENYGTIKSRNNRRDIYLAYLWQTAQIFRKVCACNEFSDVSCTTI